MLRRCLLPIIVVIGLFAPTVAQAAPPYEHTRYSGTDSFSETICGLGVTIDVEFRGVLVVRTTSNVPPTSPATPGPSTSWTPARSRSPIWTATASSATEVW